MLDIISLQKQITISVAEYIQLFKELNTETQLSVFNQIKEIYINSAFEQLDAHLPNVTISNDDIMQEIAAVRYGK